MSPKGALGRDQSVSGESFVRKVKAIGQLLMSEVGRTISVLTESV